jgi:hypothetical protein
MWLWECELRQAGFRRCSACYFQCERGFSLPEHAYVSIFVNDKESFSGRIHRSALRRVELCAFHVTFKINLDNVHFYYHEQAENVWLPGGHTSSTEIDRHGIDPRQLLELADAIACEVVAAWRGEMLCRE